MPGPWLLRLSLQMDPPSAEFAINSGQVLMHRLASLLRLLRFDRFQHRTVVADGSHPQSRRGEVPFHPLPNGASTLIPEQLHHHGERAIVRPLRNRDVETAIRALTPLTAGMATPQLLDGGADFCNL